MAIYHFSIKNIGRSDGRSAVAAAAYRSGEKLVDSVYGKEQDYTKKIGVEYKKIYAPSYTNKNLLDRQTLWNEVEKSELKKNGDLKTTARLAKEFEIAFPHEVDADTRVRMLDELAQTLVENHKVIVDAAIHAPHTKSGSDERNYHAHIMFTTRSINEQGKLGKKAREFNDDGKNITLAYRELWANIINKELERIGVIDRVSHLSHADREINLEPTQHEGSKVTQLRRMGIDTEISLKNDAIKQRNAEYLRTYQITKDLNAEIIVSERMLARLQTEQQQAQQEKAQVENQAPKVRELKDIPESEIHQLIHDRKVMLDSYLPVISTKANDLFMQDNKTKRKELEVLFEEIKQLRENIPMLFGRKQHQAKIDAEVAKYEKMRSDYKVFVEIGVEAYRKQAAEQFKKDNPIEMAKIQKAGKQLVSLHAELERRLNEQKQDNQTSQNEVLTRYPQKSDSKDRGR